MLFPEVLLSVKEGEILGFANLTRLFHIRSEFRIRLLFKPQVKHGLVHSLFSSQTTDDDGIHLAAVPKDVEGGVFSSHILDLYVAVGFRLTFLQE